MCEFRPLWLLLVLMLLGSPCQAEFLQTGPHTFQNSDLRSSVIVVPTSEDPAGLFIAHHAPLPFQLFDPSELKEDGKTTSAFFEFDATKNRFTTLRIAKHEFSIRGSFALTFGKDASLRVALAQDGIHSYLSIFTTGEKESSLLGFVGVNQLINVKGQDAPILEARSSQSDLIQDYSMLPGAQLILGETPVNTKHVGLALRSKDACLSPGAIIAAPESSDQIRDLTGDELTSANLLDGISQLDIGDLLPLRAPKGTFVGLRPATNEVFLVKQLKTVWRNGLQSVICVSERKRLTSTGVS